MKKILLTAATLVLAGAAPLAAQAPHLGFGLNLAIPTGDFSSKTYGDGTRDTYDAALGLQLMASFPVDKNFAFRVDINGMNFQGNSDYPGYPRFNLQNSMFSLAGEAQIFLGDGNALRHTGGYLIGGLSADFERFTGSYDDPAYYPDVTLNKTRMGLVVGYGYSFRYVGRWRWNVEGVYHKTLTGNDTNAGDPPSSDYFRVGFGMIF
ncbi:outer membrane beta-barrel protein [Mesoterricola sediminis]|uniref:Outer membrane protein beta-barrel domain-containing protein n=1 Tax=Mesoterricola sediminis TaxID=2927980 RepID=A0AA48KEV0_9BACT|nr:outer membrane beta-barrel protein [Mesoterricola sediminis]BDU78425.1 hypothetical protein METESE_33830 [Mesoterricola sediminis]